MKTILIKLISFYQRFISPKKGFNCAHHQRYQQGSCSEAVKLLIQKKGVLNALPEIR